jgi:hypothetical protein
MSQNNLSEILKSLTDLVNEFSDPDKEMNLSDILKYGKEKDDSESGIPWEDILKYNKETPMSMDDILKNSKIFGNTQLNESNNKPSCNQESEVVKTARSAMEKNMPKILLYLCREKLEQLKPIKDEIISWAMKHDQLEIIDLLV